MRILVLVTDAFGGHGGIATFNQVFLSAIASMEEVEVVNVLPRLGVHVPNLPDKIEQSTASKNGLRAYLSAFTNILVKEKFDLVLCGHINLLPFAQLARMRFSCPLGLVIHGLDVDRAKKRAGLRYFSRRVDLLISVSRLTLNRFQEWAPLIKGYSAVLPNCVDLNRFTPDAKSAELLDRYHINGKRVLMTFGRLAGRDREKGFDEVLEVLPKLRKEHPDLVYMIVGDGPDRSRLESKAQSLGIADAVIFAGRISEEEKVDHYRLADLYVMPSRGEGFGIVILEALACGIPVIGSKIDGTREALLDGKLGDLVDPAEPSELIYSIKHHCSKIIENRRQESIETFSVDSFTNRTHHLIKKF